MQGNRFTCRVFPTPNNESFKRAIYGMAIKSREGEYEEHIRGLILTETITSYGIKENCDMNPYWALKI